MDQRDAGSPPSAAVLLAPGFEEIELAAPVDILRRTGVAVKVLSVAGGGPVAGARGLAVVPDGPLAGELPDFDLVALPGGMPGAANLAASPAARALCERTLAAGGLVAALCASPALALGAWGLLAGRRATCHPTVLDRMPPDADAVDAPVAVDGRVVTGRDAGAAAAFALALAGILRGAERAREAALAMGLPCFVEGNP